MNFKRGTALLLVCSCLLTGCTTSAKKVDNKYVVATLEKGDKEKNIFADDLYNKMINSTSNQSTVFNAVLQNLIDQKFPIDDDMKEEANNIVEQVESSFQTNYGDDYEETLNEALTSSGYKDLEDYRQKMIQQIQYANFLLDYIDNHYDDVFADYYKQCSPKYVSLIKVSVSDMSNPTDDETAKLNEVKELLTNTDKSFGSIAQDYSDDSSSSKKGNIGIVDSPDTRGLQNTYSETVLAEADNLAEGQVSSAIEGDDGYYFLKVTSTNYDKIKKDLKDTDIDSPLLGYDNYLQYIVFDSYKITYDDKKIKNICENVVKKALEERANERGDSNE
ncbi:MAG: peptidylprolyl isomerase [Faecalibacillus sp.]